MSSREDQYSSAAHRSTPRVITDFVQKEYYRDHYVLLAERAQELIREILQTDFGGEVLANVTCRAKEEKSLEEKLVMRHVEKDYQTTEDIWEDIWDLAGVRIILYMPNEEQQNKVRGLVNSIWDDVEEKLHDGTEGRQSNDEPDYPGGQTRYRPKHLGYRATHYRAKMQEDQSIKRGYTWKERDRVEIQVLSALSHGISEIGHDILYKSHIYGAPTDEENRIMDALQGFVISGDILLEQFYAMFLNRTKAKIRNRDELAIVLRKIDLLQAEDVDLLFPAPILGVLSRFLLNTGQNSPLIIRNAFKDLGLPDLEKIKETPYYHLGTGKMGEPNAFMKLAICLVRNLLPKCPMDVENENDSFKQFCIMLNALVWIQKLYHVQPTVTNERLAKIVRDNEVRKDLNFLLGHTWYFQSEIEKSADPEWQPGHLEFAWNWFQEQELEKHSLSGFAFRVAKTEAYIGSDFRIPFPEELTIGGLRFLDDAT